MLNLLIAIPHYTSCVFFPNELHVSKYSATKMFVKICFTFQMLHNINCRHFTFFL